MNRLSVTSTSRREGSRRSSIDNQAKDWMQQRKMLYPLIHYENDERSGRDMKTKRLAIMGLFVALMCISAWIRVPLPIIPLTFQTAVVALAAMLLMPWEAFIVMVVYVTLGLCGVPVFASGGGFQYITSPTFGYLIGFIVAALLGSTYLNRKPVSSGLPTAKGFLKGLESSEEEGSDPFGFGPNLITGMIVVMVVFMTGVTYTWGYARFVTDNPLAFTSLFTTYMGLLWIKDSALAAVMAAIAPRIRKHID
jgi:biotin transport system substrate-specific component